MTQIHIGSPTNCVCVCVRCSIPAVDRKATTTALQSDRTDGGLTHCSATTATTIIAEMKTDKQSRVPTDKLLTDVETKQQPIILSLLPCVVICDCPTKSQHGFKGDQNLKVQSRREPTSEPNHRGPTQHRTPGLYHREEGRSRSPAHTEATRVPTEKSNRGPEKTVSFLVFSIGVY